MKYKIIISLAFVFSYNLLMAQQTNKEKGFHTFLGVDVDNTSIKTNGLFVNGVYKGYPAEKAGLQRGDTLKAINAVAVHNFDELIKTLDKYKGGDNVEVFFVRNNTLQTMAVTLADYPEFLKYNSMQWLKKMKLKGFEGDVIITTLGVDVESVWNDYAVKVTEVINNSGAEQAGIKTGDIILKMDNYEFATIEELKYYLSKYKPGDVVTLLVIQNGEKKNMRATLGKETIHINDVKNKS